MAKTWQSTVVEINPGAYSEMSILSGKANVFMATNASDEDIYIGLGEIPRADSYEKVLKRNSTDVFGRPTPVNRVYFLNLSATVVSLKVWYSWDEEFDYTLLKSMTVDLKGAALDAIKFDGVIQGFKTGVSLAVTNAAFNQIQTNTANTNSKLDTANSHLTNIKTNAATAASKLTEMLTIMQQEQSTNATILEGINTILATL